MVLHPKLPVSAETRRRWQRRGQIPAVAALAAQLLAGELGEISPAWNGWTLQCDALHAPNGDLWTPPFLLAWGYQRQELEELRRWRRRPEQYRLL